MYFTSVIILVVLFAIILKTFKKTSDFLLPNKKLVLVSGCDSGIGLETAIHLHQLGFHVFAGCLSVESDGALKMKKINSESLVVVQMDITKQSEIDAAIEALEVYCEKNSCQLWSLVNNAGVCIAGKIEWQTWDQIEKQVNVNLLGTIRMIRTCLPMLKQTRGRIINVGSISARWPYPKFGPYVASKSAVEAMSEVLRVDMATYGIKVIVVAPGNYCRITKLFEHQMEYAKQQWDSLAPEIRKELEGKFWNLQTNIIELSKIQCPSTFENSEIIRDMQSAVMGIEPKPYYLSSTLVLKLLLYVYEFMPIQVRDYLMILMDSYSLKEKKDVPFFLKM